MLVPKRVNSFSVSSPPLNKYKFTLKVVRLGLKGAEAEGRGGAGNWSSACQVKQRLVSIVESWRVIDM